MKINKQYLWSLLACCFVVVCGRCQKSHEVIRLDTLFQKNDKLKNNLNIVEYHNLGENGEIKGGIIVFRTGVIPLLIILIFIAAFMNYRKQTIRYPYRRQNVYRIRMKILFDKRDERKEQPSIRVGATTVAALDISEKALNNITEKLKTFIEEKQFLSNTVSLNELAKAMDTNPNYLSRFINFNEGKNFSAYIKDLRINYAVAELKTNAIFRKYSIKAIAEELGFNNEQSFSKAFYKKTGIYPSYFIKELEKEVLKKRSA